MEASVPGFTTAVLDPLGLAIDVFVSDVWITDCTIISSRYGKSSYMLSSHTLIFSSLVFASDSSAAMSSICTSLMVVEGTLDVAGTPSVSTASNKEEHGLSDIGGLGSGRSRKSIERSERT
ncbi:hypothetical protein H5410_015353 [Solanum commersonii]|uniref:Uncharacterized protein n=1 Tax=Solanum commersonii TaxID=4109 RepID=A0A9J5ZTJ0_SOLCO|nr:hypothetical protein H5410_015353 [Solanum commersonii]